MSDTVQGSDPSDPASGPTAAQRVRTVADVAVGVTLCVSLLLPAVQQASTGTLSGLRNGLLLLVLAAVALVALSRFVTRPGRDVGRRRPTSPARSGPSGPALTREQAAALFDESGAPLDVPGLSLSDVGISVRQGSGVAHANLAWQDCVAIVYSRLREPGGAFFTSLQFVAAREDLIRRGVSDKGVRSAAKVLGLTETAAAMVWVAPPQLEHVTPLLLEHVAREHPRVRLVRPDVVEDV